jgi:hypothetical protein
MVSGERFLFLSINLFRHSYETDNQKTSPIIAMSNNTTPTSTPPLAQHGTSTTNVAALMQEIADLKADKARMAAMLPQPSPTPTPSPEPTNRELGHDIKTMMAALGEVSNSQKVMHDRVLNVEGFLCGNPNPYAFTEPYGYKAPQFAQQQTAFQPMVGQNNPMPPAGLAPNGRNSAAPDARPMQGEHHNAHKSKTPAPTFSGSENENIVTWFHHFGDWADARQLPPESVVNEAVMALKHDAVEVWYNIRHQILSKGINPNDWAVFKEHMLAQYVDVGLELTVRPKLRDLKQTGSVTEYHRQFRTIQV